MVLRLTRLRALCIVYLVPLLGIQAQGIVHGSVTAAETAQPMFGADVGLPSLRRATLADSTGVYRLSDLPSGTHELEVSLKRR